MNEIGKALTERFPTCLCCGKGFKKSIGWYGKTLLCTNCNTVFTPLCDKTIYNEHYHDRYVKYESSEENDPIQKIRWNNVLKYAEKGLLLDIGCGVGAFLDWLKTHDRYGVFNQFEIFGQDINQHCVETCKNKGIECYNDLSDILYWNKFDVITMWDVIEHFDDFKIISTIKDSLKPGGHFIISTPNFKIEYAENIENWHHYRPYEHVTGFSADSFKAMAKRFDFEFVEYNFDESKVRQPDENIITVVLRKPE